MSDKSQVLKETILKLCEKPKGILAADESPTNLSKKFTPLNIENNELNRNKYREMLFTSPDIEKYISGVILHEETFSQKILGIACPKFLESKGIVPGIKVDLGLTKFGYKELGNNEETTLGIETLADRLPDFFSNGARFAKWRTVFKISDSTPSAELISANAMSQANYAKACQENGIVPIVEPEILVDGMHTIDECYNVSVKVLKAVFNDLNQQGVDVANILLKPSMVLAGSNATSATEEDIANLTFKVLSENVPHNVPGIVFLSGGQTEEESTNNLANISALNNLPWRITYSYGRALQTSSVNAWAGRDENIQKGQQAFLERAKANSTASVA